MKYLGILIAVLSLATVLVTGALGRSTPVPIDLAKVQQAVVTRFGDSYDWHCQLQSDVNREAVCSSNPNGYYTATYHIRDDGTLVLENYVPPPA